ncbi:hypothetical protein HOE22_00975 [Candidatus Woesearchaeota archaeon]|jgi:hypothetical protein|nr:hypothetical protein [Candidatus Woesearchaeota archaeon]
MNKAYLDRFISKYSLGDSVNSVVLNVNNEVLTTEFITLDKSLLGKVTLDTFQFEDVQLGIYDTKQLASLLSVLNDDINLTVVKSEDKVVSIKFEDSYASVNYMLSDLSVIPDVPSMKSVPEFELSLKIDSLFITKFISGKNALAESETFTVLTDANTDSCKFVINYSAINTNRVNLPVTVDTFSDVGPLSFNAELFAKVLQANKECESASMEISSKGLARASFKVDNYDAVYNLVASQSVD